MGKVNCRKSWLIYYVYCKRLEIWLRPQIINSYIVLGSTKNRARIFLSFFTFSLIVFFNQSQCFLDSFQDVLLGFVPYNLPQFVPLHLGDEDHWSRWPFERRHSTIQEGTELLYQFLGGDRIQLASYRMCWEHVMHNSIQSWCPIWKRWFNFNFLFP